MCRIIIFLICIILSLICNTVHCGDTLFANKTTYYYYKKFETGAEGRAILHDLQVTKLDKKIIRMRYVLDKRLEKRWSIFRIGCFKDSGKRENKRNTNIIIYGEDVMNSKEVTLQDAYDELGYVDFYIKDNDMKIGSKYKALIYIHPRFINDKGLEFKQYDPAEVTNIPGTNRPRDGLILQLFYESRNEYRETMEFLMFKASKPDK